MHVPVQSEQVSFGSVGYCLQLMVRDTNQSKMFKMGASSISMNSTVMHSQRNGPPSLHTKHSSMSWQACFLATKDGAAPQQHNDGCTISRDSVLRDLDSKPAAPRQHRMLVRVMTRQGCEAVRTLMTAMATS